MYIVWLFNIDGTAVDYQFHRWDEAIEFMVSLHKPKWAHHKAIQTTVEWELCRAQPYTSQQANARISSQCA